MSDIFKLLTAPLDHSFALTLILVGLYSLIINAKHDTKQNYICSAKFARIAGWCHIVGGIGILILK
jgi:hypothetical protein